MNTGATTPPIERLVYLARALRSGRLLHLWHVAEHFEVNIRTVRRDFDYLRDRLGYQVEYNREKRGWFLVKAPEAVL